MQTTDTHADDPAKTLKSSGTTRKKTRVEKGIRCDQFGWEVYFCANGRATFKRFPRHMSLEAMREWRREAQRKARAMPSEKLLALKLAPLPRGERSLAPCESGWCYVYFIQDGDGIKIGKAIDPWRRLDDLQTAHRNKLTLAAAVPAHADFEKAVHQVFGYLSTGREWFVLDHRLASFIERLKDGQNPVAILWAEIGRYGNNSKFLCRGPRKCP